MTKVEELERVVASLAVEEYEEFRRWFLESDWGKWISRLRRIRELVRWIS